MTIGNRISTLRRERKLTQEYLAQALNVSRQAVSKWENDQTAPDTNNLIALAALFQVSVEYLATGKEVSPTNPQEGGCVRQPDRDIGAILGTIAMLLLFLVIPINFVGYLSGAFRDMLSIPISDHVRMGIYLGYGESPLAVILLVLEATAVLAAIVLFAIAFSMARRKKKAGNRISQ